MTRFHNRYLSKPIKTFLKNRMVFVGGPRQAGKTTLCLQWLSPKSIKSPAYLHWEDPQARYKIKHQELPHNQKVLLFDEIHKFKKWRSLMKGLYDTKKYKYKFLVTGSARLDLYRRGGDSLLGRYRYLRLHPLTLKELHFFSESNQRLTKIRRVSRTFF